MKIPKKLKIGGHWFKIELKHKTEGYDSSGTKFSWLNKIILQKDMVLSKQTSTLFHEIIHEIGWQNGLELTEVQVESLSECMYQVLNDNGFLT